MFKHRLYFQRCCDLLGMGQNNIYPTIGGVLINNEKIIGEGYGNHLNNLLKEIITKNNLIIKNELSQATLYIAIAGNAQTQQIQEFLWTIKKNNIPKIYFGLLNSAFIDLRKEIESLNPSGIDIKVDLLTDKVIKHNVSINAFEKKSLPYVILKFAQSLNQKMGVKNKNIWISNPYTKRLTHKWRSEIDAILIGTQTLLVDNPQLDNRYYFGKSPLKLLIKRDGLIKKETAALHSKGNTIIICSPNASQSQGIKYQYWQIPFDNSLLINILKNLKKEGLNSLLVEGGASLLNSFLKENLWDEARVFTSNQVIQDQNAISAPNITGNLTAEIPLSDDMLRVYKKSRSC